MNKNGYQYLKGDVCEGKKYINKNEVDEMEICGYEERKARTFLVWLLSVLTLGFPMLLFYWIPQLRLYATCVKCKTTDADFIMVKEEIKNGRFKYHIKRLKTLTPELIRRSPSNQTTIDFNYKLLPVHFGGGVFQNLDRILLFGCKKNSYIYDETVEDFVKLRGFDEGISRETLQTFRGLSPEEQASRRATFGPNKIVIPEKTIIELLLYEILDPYYVFQTICIVVWFYEGYNYYPIAVILLSAFGIIMTVLETRENQAKLKETFHSSDLCTVIRGREGDSKLSREVISSELLVPGDVIEVPSQGCHMHCDALLLNGSCVLNESMLTGESVPVVKTAFFDLPDRVYNVKEHSGNTLFSGTQVIQTRGVGDDRRVIAVVTRTGFLTSKGGLVRSVLYPPVNEFLFEQHSLQFGIVIACIGALGLIYSVVTGIQAQEQVSYVILDSLDVISVVALPGLPAAITVGIYYAQRRLSDKKIYSLSPRSVNVAGSIDCICFDKTGTLTENGLDLLSVVPISGKTFAAPSAHVERLTFPALGNALVSCHSLTTLDGKLFGDPMDQKIFEITKWSISQSNGDDFRGITPLGIYTPPDLTEDARLALVKEFAFSSNLQRMGVVVAVAMKSTDEQRFEYYCKGSPEVIVDLSKPESVPEDFQNVLKSYTRQGYRVIAIAHKVLELEGDVDMRAVQREDLERDLTLLGLIVFENKLKPDSKTCIQDLNEAEFRIVMITGDNILTAISVAKECQIVKPDQDLIMISSNQKENSELLFTRVSNREVGKPVRDVDVEKNQGNNDYRFALTGKEWEILRKRQPDLLPKVLTRGGVYARMAPEQKQQLVEELQRLGYFVAMCGDGSNDCGALKSAHTGISFTEAESSVASPFTASDSSISCVAEVIREGRSTLVSTMALFKFMAAGCLNEFVSLLMLYSVGTLPTDMESLYIDIFLITNFSIFMGSTKPNAGKLCNKTPVTSLTDCVILLSLFLQAGLMIIFQTIAFLHMQYEPWYVPNDDYEGLTPVIEQYTSFAISNFQYIILALVFSRGKPYRSWFFSNVWLSVMVIFFTSFSLYILIDPADPVRNFFQLVIPPSDTFKWYILLYTVITFFLSFLIEYGFVEGLVGKVLRPKFTDINKSKKKYLAIEKELETARGWFRVQGAGPLDQCN